MWIGGLLTSSQILSPHNVKPLLMCPEIGRTRLAPGWLDRAVSNHTQLLLLLSCRVWARIPHRIPFSTFSYGTNKTGRTVVKSACSDLVILTDDHHMLGEMIIPIDQRLILDGYSGGLEQIVNFLASPRISFSWLLYSIWVLVFFVLLIHLIGRKPLILNALSENSSCVIRCWI